MSITTKQSGFSLVEMLVAVSVLLIVIIGPMTVTSRVAKSSSFATEQVQAFFLAQEGLELAEKIRDDLMLQHFYSGVNNPWGRFIDSSNSGAYRRCHSTSGCGLDWNNTNVTALSSIVDCATTGACELKYNANGARSRYTYTGGVGTVATPYTRVVRFSTTADGKAVLVTSTVSWRTGSVAAQQQVQTSTYLYNIYDKP